MKGRSKMLEKNEKILKNSVKIGVYCIYDKVAQIYENVFSCRESEVSDYCQAIVNSVESKFYGHESDYQLIFLCNFNELVGTLDNIKTKVVSELSVYIDQRRRDLQTCIQTLNFVPNGFHKLDDEMRQEIQDKIDNAVDYYVKNIIDLEKLKKSNSPRS